MRLITLLAFASALTGIARADANADLLEAARTGDLAAVKTAIASGAAVETKTPYGQTPLFVAALGGHDEVVRVPRLLRRKRRRHVQHIFAAGNRGRPSVIGREIGGDKRQLCRIGARALQRCAHLWRTVERPDSGAYPISLVE